jgi:2',3'-cyclic-nucleotide 2'-phosphodiesterase (5'-nucleotidase family)
MADPKLPPHVVFLQLNDVYHIDAKSDYANQSSLIFPRVSTILSRARSCIAERGGSSFLCVPGDFLAPSCLSKETFGAHMIELLKLLNTSMATFGNHEFESFRGTTKTKPPPYPLFEMIEQSTFPWVSSNFKFDNHQKASHLRASGKLISYFPIRLNERHEIDVLGFLYEADDPLCRKAHPG